ncbi:MAG: HAD family phosphatase [Candidatus Woesebacteria bacterium]|nr:HAD family phosphatase [Candidatus Woesebacteria bacterium]
MIYKAIGFDYGGVIAGPTGSKFSEAICALFNITKEKFREVYFRHNTILNDGDMTYTELWTIFAQEIGQPEKTEDLLKLVAEWPTHRINEDVLELTQKLKNAGYKIGMLSNNNFANKEIMLKGGLEKIFNPLLISSEIKASKPWPEAYKIFAEKMGFPPEEIIFIDDGERNIINAREFGFTGIVFINYKSLIAELSDLGVKLEE